MANPDMNQADQDRVSRGQSIAKGDTGDGDTGVPAHEQGISNRPGDKDRVDQERVAERDDESDIGGDEADDAARE